MADTNFLTISQIAYLLYEPPQRVAYIIRNHRMKPVQRIGTTRLFNQDQIETIKLALRNIQIRRVM